MANALFAWRNAVATATLTASSAVPALDAQQLKTDQGSPSTAWQTAAGTTTATLTIDTGNAASTWRAFLIARTNLTSAATVRWRVGSAYDSGTIAAGVAAGFGQSLTAALTEVAGAVCILDISDPTNPDGFLSVPLVYAGPAWQPLTNVSWDTAFGRDDETEEVTTRGGQEYPQFRWTRRRWEVALQGVRATETWPQCMELDRIARMGGNVLFVPDPVGAQRNRETVFGRGKPTSDLTFPYQAADRRGYRIRVTERL